MTRQQFRIMILPALLGCLGLVLTGCATVPETGRQQLVLISSSEEMQLGMTSFDQMKKESKISRDPALNALVQKVGKRIASVAPLPNAQWEFVVFESKEPNAFCLPGGKVGIYTAIFAITRDEAGLATVIGHEVSHAVARHGAERMSETLLMQTGSSVLGASLSKADPRVQTAAVLAYGLGSQIGYTLPHSRKQESEADEIGLIYMARAGYNPEAAVGFWERFAAFSKQTGGGSGPAFLRTHPLDDVRIRQIKEWLPRAKQEYRLQP